MTESPRTVDLVDLEVASIWVIESPVMMDLRLC